VSNLLYAHIKASHRANKTPSEAAELFFESKMVAHQEFNIRASHGFALTMGGYNAAVSKRKMATSRVTPSAISDFMMYLFETMDLAIECVLISYIYIKRLLLAGIMEIRK